MNPVIRKLSCNQSIYQRIAMRNWEIRATLYHLDCPRFYKCHISLAMCSAFHGALSVSMHDAHSVSMYDALSVSMYDALSVSIYDALSVSM